MHLLQNQTVLSHCLRLFSFSFLHTRRQTSVSDAIVPVRKESQRPGCCLGPLGVPPPHPERHTPPVCNPLPRFSATGHSVHQNTWGGQRVRQENPPSERNGQGSSGRWTKPNAPRWRCRFWPQTQRFQHKAQPQGRSDGHEGRAVCKLREQRLGVVRRLHWY